MIWSKSAIIQTSFLKPGPVPWQVQNLPLNHWCPLDNSTDLYRNLMWIMCVLLMCYHFALWDTMGVKTFALNCKYTCIELQSVFPKSIPKLQSNRVKRWTDRQTHIHTLTTSNNKHFWQQWLYSSFLLWCCDCCWMCGSLSGLAYV